MDDNILNIDYKSIIYPECEKGNYHFGEKVNMICTDEVCELSKIGCAACMEFDHENHKSIPLKLLFH